MAICDRHPDGVHLLGYSQGGLIARGILETFADHNVKNFISLSSPQAGQFGSKLMTLISLRIISVECFDFQRNFCIWFFHIWPHKPHTHYSIRMLDNIRRWATIGMIHINRICTTNTVHICRISITKLKPQIRRDFVAIYCESNEWYWLVDHRMVWLRRGNQGLLWRMKCLARSRVRIFWFLIFQSFRLLRWGRTSGSVAGTKNLSKRWHRTAYVGCGKSLGNCNIPTCQPFWMAYERDGHTTSHFATFRLDNIEFYEFYSTPSDRTIKQMNKLKIELKFHRMLNWHWQFETVTNIESFELRRWHLHIHLHVHRPYCCNALSVLTVLATHTNTIA